VKWIWNDVGHKFVRLCAPYSNNTPRDVSPLLWLFIKNMIRQFGLITSHYANCRKALVESIIPSLKQKTSQKELFLIPNWRNMMPFGSRGGVSCWVETSQICNVFGMFFNIMAAFARRKLASGQK